MYDLIVLLRFRGGCPTRKKRLVTPPTLPGAIVYRQKTAIAARAQLLFTKPFFDATHNLFLLSAI